MSTLRLDMFKKPAIADNSEKIAHWANRLELANAMKAGVMDSENRHMEIAKMRHSIISSVIAEMRA